MGKVRFLVRYLAMFLGKTKKYCAGGWKLDDLEYFCKNFHSTAEHFPRCLVHG